MKKLISIVTPCFNEEENIVELCDRIRSTMSTLPYDYEHILIDNHSTDHTVLVIKKIASIDRHVKLIVNARNFGQIRSPHYGILQSHGDVCILLTSDLQDPPEIIPEFINRWIEGYKIVLAVKPESEESKIMFFIRKLYYHLISNISEVQLIKHATGAGLFDRTVIEVLRRIPDANPYFRGLLCEIGFPIAVVPFKQPRRKRGVTKNNFYKLFDIAMLGITNHSKIPIRMMTIGGVLLALFSILLAFVFLVAKLMYWDEFKLGISPLLVGTFLFFGINFFFLGILGEYVGAIHTQVRNMPLVVELERVNFDIEGSADHSNISPIGPND